MCKMAARKRWAIPESSKKGGVYSHYSTPRALPTAFHPTMIRQWAHGGDVDRLELVVLEGQGERLMEEPTYEPRTHNFLKVVPQMIAKCRAIHEAVTKGSLEQLRTLLQAEPARKKFALCKDPAGVGLLHKAVYYDYQDIAIWLIENFPETIFQRDSEGRTPLHYATLSRSRKMAAMLERAGAEAGARDTAGRTPAHYRAPAVRARLVLPQPPRAADMTNTNKRGMVFRHSNLRIWCHDCDMEQLQKIVWECQGNKLLLEMSNQPIVKKFLEAVPYIMNTIKKAHAAVIEGDIEELRKVTDEPVASVLLTSKDQNGLTVLHKAAGLGHDEMVDYIVGRHRNVINQVDNEGRTPLFYAAANPNSDSTFQTLVNLGAKQEILDDRDRSAAYYINRPAEIDRTLLTVIPNAPRRGNGPYPPSWDWKYLKVDKSDIKLEKIRKTRRRHKSLTERSSNNSEAVKSPVEVKKDLKISRTQEFIKSLPDLSDSAEKEKPEKTLVKKIKVKEGASEILTKTSIRRKITQRTPTTQESQIAGADNETTGVQKLPVVKSDNMEVEQKTGAKSVEEAPNTPVNETVFYGKKLDTNNISDQSNPSTAEKSHPSTAEQSHPSTANKSNPSTTGKSNPSTAEKSDQKSTAEKSSPSTAEKFNSNTTEKSNPSTAEKSRSNTAEKSSPIKADKSMSCKASLIPESNSNGESKHRNKLSFTPEKSDFSTPNSEKSPQTPKSQVSDTSSKVYADTKISQSELSYARKTPIHKSNSESIVISETTNRKGTVDSIDSHSEAQNSNTNNQNDQPKIRSRTATLERSRESLIIGLSEKDDDDDVKAQGDSETARSSKNTRDSQSGQSNKENTTEDNVFSRSTVKLNSGRRANNGLNGATGDILIVRRDDEMTNTEDNEVTDMIKSGNMELLAGLVLNGEGNRLLGRTSENKEIQAFIENVPTYMKKINRVHLAAREGNIRDLQAALDRRKFAIARDPISPNGATPLHVATVFGKSNIMKYLGGRFPETLSAVDFEGRTALHYAAVLPDNGHYYNLLQHIGANAKDVDDNGVAAEEYLKSGSHLSYKELLTAFGIEEGLGNEMFEDRVPNDQVSSRRELEDPEVLNTLERCFSLLNSNISPRPNEHRSASSNRGPPPMFLGRFLRRPIFDSISTRITKLDHDLFDVIWPAVKKISNSKNMIQTVEEDFPGGVMAPDYYVFDVFDEFLIPLVKDLHNAHFDLVKHPESDFIQGTLNISELDLDPSGDYILSGTIECVRNLDGLELPLNLNIGQLETVERIITEVVMTEEFMGLGIQSKPESDQTKGSYYTLNEVLEKPSEINEILSKAGLLVPLCERDEIDDPDQLHGRFWPYGRGVYLSDDNSVAIWINVQDHLRIIINTPQESAGEIGYAFAQMTTIMTYLHDKLKFKWDTSLGYLTSRPTFLGCSLRFSLLISLPNLTKDKENIENLCSMRGLELRETIQDDVIRVSNHQCLGITESECFKDFTTACGNLIQIEGEITQQNVNQISTMLSNIFKRKRSSLSSEAAE